MDTQEAIPTYDDKVETFMKLTRAPKTHEPTVGERLEQMVKDDIARKALPENSPLAQWAKRNFDRDPSPLPRSRLWDLFDRP